MLEHLRLDSDERLLDLPEEDREELYEHFIGIARARLAELDLDEDNRTQLGDNPVLLIEETLEEQGDFAEAAVLHALGHDRFRRVDGMAGVARVLCRFKLGNALLLLNEDDPRNQLRCLDLARRTIILLDALEAHQQLPASAARALSSKLHAWCGWRCQELGRIRDAAQAFTDAALRSDDLDDRIEHTTKSAELVARDGRKQEAYALLLSVRDELPGVADPEIRIYWESVFRTLEWELGGTFTRTSDTPSPIADGPPQFFEAMFQATSQALHADRVPDQSPAAEMIPLLAAELKELDSDDLLTRHRVLLDLAFALLQSGAHQQAEQRLLEAEQLEDHLGDGGASLKRRVCLAQIHRFRRDQESAANLLGSLLPEARRILNPNELLSLLGEYLEALAKCGGQAQDLRPLVEEVTALLEAELRRQPGGAARRRARFVHQRAVEAAVLALLSRVETIGADSDQGQQLLATAWRVVMAARNPELGGRNRQPPSNLQAELGKLENRMHAALRATIVAGNGSRTEWTELLREVMEYEISSVTSPREATFQHPLHPMGVAVTFFEVRDLFPNSPLVILARHEGRFEVRLLPEAEHQPLRDWSDHFLGSPRPAAQETTAAPEQMRHIAAGWPTAPVELETAPLVSQLLPRNMLLLPIRKPLCLMHAGGETESWRSAPLSSEPWFLFPDGPWCAMPFEMLQEHQESTACFGQNRAVQLCLRSGVVPLAMEKVDFERGWLGLGGVPGTGLVSELPGSQREVMGLQRFLGERGIPARTLLGRDAQAGNLRALLGELQPAVLHIAAHAVADQEHPEACALILAHSETPEGELLPFRCISRLPLDGVDLVVLSACSSLIGRSDRSAGMEGLTWAFLEAGAGQVIASRYPVDDESTVTLMLALYRHLQELPAAEALGRARDDCLRQPDPLHEREVGAWAVWS